MDKIASPQDLQAELRRLLAYSQTEKPSREKLAGELLGLADKVAKTGPLLNRVYDLSDEIGDIKRALGDNLDRDGIKAFRDAATAVRALEAIVEKAEKPSRTAAQTWTVLEKNELAEHLSHYVGTFNTEEEAVAYAEKQAKRSRKFAVFTVYTGAPRNPGKATKHEFRGVH